MFTETAAYAAERIKLQTQPIAFARFSHVKKSGDGTDYPFSVDFTTQAVLAPTKTELAYMVKPGLVIQSIDHENGRSSIGTLPIRLVDVTGEILKYLSAPALTLAATMTAGQLTATVTEDPSGMPAKGTLEITSGGVIERARYSSYVVATKIFTLTARGVDGTTAATHAISDAVTNGEQIRPGQRVQLFTGYAALNEADYTAWPKMEVTSRDLLQDRITFQVQAFDIQRSVRRTVFLGATTDVPVSLTGNPITLALQILLSTGLGTNGPYDVLTAANGLGLPQALVDVAGLEALRTSDFSADTYVFSITGPQNGKQFLEEQFWKTTNCYPVIKQDGKLSVRRYKAGGTAVATLDTSTIVSWGWAMGDQQIINEVQFDYDWDLTATRGIFAKRQIYTSQSSVDKYGKRQPLLISSMGIRTANGGQAILDNRAFEVVKLFAEPALALTVDTFYRHHLLEAGDNVSVTHSLIPNPQTGIRGLTAERFLVMNIEPRLEAGMVRFRLLWVGGVPAQAAPDPGGATTQPIPIRDDQAPVVPTGLAAGTGTTVDVDGTIQVFLDYSWTANTEADLDRYELQFKRQADTNWTTRMIPKGTTALREVGLVSNVATDARLRAIDIWGNASAFSTVVTITTDKDATAPPTPSGVTGGGGVESALIRWTPYVDKDFEVVEVWRSTINDRLTASKVGESKGQTFFDLGLLSNTTYFFWLRARDTSGNLSAFHAGDAAGLAVTVALLVGYKLTLNSITPLPVFTPTIANDNMVAALLLDATDREVDWLVRVGSDLHFGETTPNAVVQTALGLKFTGDSRIAGDFDGTNHQLTALLSNNVRYGKMDKDGTVLTALADKFTAPAGTKYVQAAVSAQGASLYWVLVQDTPDVGTFVNTRLRFARTDLSGTVQVAAVDITGTVLTVGPGSEVRIATDSEGNSHILFKLKTITAFQVNAFQANAFQTQAPDLLRYVKVDASGAVLIAVSAPLDPPPGAADVSPAMIYRDNSDGLHVLGYTVFTGGLAFSYGRMNKAGTVLVPLVLFWAAPSSIVFGRGTMDRANNQLYLAWATGTGLNQLRLDPVDPTGETVQSALLMAGL